MDQQNALTFTVTGLMDVVENTGFSGVGSIAAQPYFAAVTRRAVMAAVNTLGRELGLRPATIMVLDALLSCLPCTDPKSGQDRPVTPLTLLTVYASNDTLCFRAKGIADRQLRRHLERLEERGLIHRRDSANGKRFPILRQGKVVGAFGIDLSPLFQRASDLIEAADHNRKTAEELRGLRAQVLRLRQECLALDLDEMEEAAVSEVHRCLRRTGLTLGGAKILAAQLSDLIQRHREAQPEPAPIAPLAPEETACDGQNDRHKDPQYSKTKKEDTTGYKDWSDLKALSELFPEPPRSEHKLLSILFDFGNMLRIDAALLARAISKLGIRSLLSFANEVAADPDRIRNPSGYLAQMLKSRVGHGQLSPTI
jgi:replication initiation protein RepC